MNSVRRKAIASAKYDILEQEFFTSLNMAMIQEREGKSYSCPHHV